MGIPTQGVFELAYPGFGLKTIFHKQLQLILQ